MISELKQRVLINGSSVIILILLIAYANSYYFSPIFVGFVAFIQAIALWEYYLLVRKKQINPAIILGLICSIIYVFASFLKAQGQPFWHTFPEIILAVTFFAVFTYFALKGEQPIVNIATTFFGIIYITIPMALIVRIVYFFHETAFGAGALWLIFLIAVAKSADTAAFFVGKKFGNIKLASKLSPNKTLEGALAGLVAAVLTAVIIFAIGKQTELFSSITLSEILILGLALGIFGQLGDLAESLLKRDAQVKDSNKIPGVGGLLDMIDSLLFTAPIIYIFLKNQI